MFVASLWSRAFRVLGSPIGLLLLVAAEPPHSEGEWPTYRHDRRLTGRSDDAGDLTSPVVAWEYDLRGYRWSIAVEGAETSTSLELTDAMAQRSFNAKDKATWGLGPRMVDLTGNGTPQPAPAYAAKILDDVPGLQHFEVKMTDGVKGHCALYAHDQGRRLIWESEPFDVFQGPHPVIADANADGQLDVVVCPHYQVAVLDGRSGEIVEQLRWHNGRNYGHFIVKNIDDDPALEMCVIADFYSHLAVIDNDGKDLKLLWSKMIDPTISNKQKILRPRWDCLRDLDGDGSFELVVNLHNDTGDKRWHLTVYDAVTGQKRLDLPDTFVEGLEDLDGDGTVELFCAKTTALFVPTSAPLEILNYDAGAIRTRWSHPDGAWATASRTYPLNINSTVAHANRNVVVSHGSSGDATFYIESPPRRPDKGPSLRAFRANASGSVEPVWTCEGPTGSKRFSVEATRVKPGGSTATLVSLSTSGPAGSCALKGAGATVLGQERQPPEFAKWGSMIAARLGAERRVSIVAMAGNRDVAVLSAENNDPRLRWRHSGAGTLVAADVDGDGGRELAVLDWQPSGEGSVTVLGADGSARWRSPVAGFPGPLEPWNFGTLTVLAAGRFTGAVHDDLAVFARRSTMHSDECFVLSGDDGQIVWRQDAAFDGSTKWGFGGTPVAVFDHNGDGGEDIYSLYPVNYTVMSGRDGSQLLGRSAAGDDIFPGIWAAYSLPTLFDFDADSRPELVWSGGYCLGMTDLAGSTRWAVKPAQTGYPVDWKGDGRPSIAALSGSELVSYEPEAGKEQWRLPLAGKRDSAMVGDLDGDGRDELAVVHGDAISCVGLAKNEDRPEVHWTVELPAVVKEAILADSDGDARLEVVALAENGRLYGIDQSAEVGEADDAPLKRSEHAGRAARLRARFAAAAVPATNDAAAGANDLVLDPQEGLAFVQEEGVRISHPGFESPSEPDCQVFRENGRTLYRMWWTTRRYAEQAKLGENRWSSHVSVSSDGLDFRYERGPEFRKGRVTNRTDRDLLRLPDGRWRAYTLVGGGNPWYCIDSYSGAETASGWQWEPGMRVNFGGPGTLDHTAARAPEAVLLPDGRVRVYYIGWNGSKGPYASDPQSGERWRILSAVAKDGLAFEKEPGARIDVDPDADPPHGAVSMAKPQLVRLKDGRWRMYFAASAPEESGPSLLFSAVSENGLRWRREPGVRLVDGQGRPIYGKYPSLVRTSDGKLRLYYDGGGGIRSAVSRR